MKSFLLLIISFVLFAFDVSSGHFQQAEASQDNKTIILTSPAIYSITKMLTNSSRVKYVGNASGCPHHFHLRPSDINTLSNASLVIMIDRRFESGITSILDKMPTNRLYLSDSNQLQIKNNNYHVWLDLRRVQYILNELKNVLLVNGFPGDSLEEKYKIATKKLNNLIKPQIPKNTLILGESLFYLFKEDEAHYFDIPDNKSVKKIHELQNYIKENNIQLIIHDSEISTEFVHKVFSGEIVEISTEDWQDIQNADFIFYINSIYSKIQKKNSKK